MEAASPDGCRHPAGQRAKLRAGRPRPGALDLAAILCPDIPDGPQLEPPQHRGVGRSRQGLATGRGLGGRWEQRGRRENGEQRALSDPPRPMASSSPEGKVLGGDKAIDLGCAGTRLGLGTSGCCHDLKGTLLRWLPRVGWGHTIPPALSFPSWRVVILD